MITPACDGELERRGGEVGWTVSPTGTGKNRGKKIAGAALRWSRCKREDNLMLNALLKKVVSLSIGLCWVPGAGGNLKVRASERKRVRIAIEAGIKAGRAGPFKTVSLRLAFALVHTPALVTQGPTYSIVIISRKMPAQYHLEDLEEYLRGMEATEGEWKRNWHHLDWENVIALENVQP
jgi:hypothetical protein